MTSELPKHIVEPLSGAVGYLVINWAMVETYLDYNMAIIFHAAGGRSVEAKMGKALNQKIKFLRRSYRRLALLEPFAAEALPLIDRASRLSDTRHIVCHGVISKFDDQGEMFMFRRLNLADGFTMHTSKAVWIAGKQIHDDGVECEQLAAKFHDLTDRLLRTLVPEYQALEIIR